VIGEPDLVHGAWTRRSVAIDRGPHFETQFVVWIQAGACYADVRIPFHPHADARCFSGRSGWDADGYRWTHRVDLEDDAPSADDFGTLTWEADALVERGVFPTRDGDVGYEEVWIRMPGSRGRFLALEGPAACLVRVGDHAITVRDRRPAGGTFDAVYRRFDDGTWATVAVIGSDRCLPSPADPPSEWSVVHTGVCP
jgi:hypothetical protein